MPWAEEPPLPEPPGDVDEGMPIEETSWTGSAHSPVPAAFPGHPDVPGPGSPARARSESDGQFRVSPQDIDAERAVLGSILIDRDAMTEVADFLAPGDFCRPVHAAIFEAMSALARAGQPVDVVTVASELDRVGELQSAGGASYLSLLGNHTPTAAHVVQYARIVADAARSRGLISAAGKIAELGYARDPDAVSRATEILRDTAARRLMPATDIVARTGARCLARVSTAPPSAPLLGYLDPQGHTVLHGKIGRAHV